MSNKVTLTDTALVVEPRGLDKMWTFTGSLEIPWDHVRGATHDPGMKQEPKGWRGPGLRVGQKLSGTFHADGERQFWNVNGFEDAVVIELRDEDYTRLIVSLDDPVGSAARINERAQAD
ncbi:hypothetical protein [Corynebacterium massiliense]|uniref:Uncharacterized protein n=1 Tax=Corynebacterium massiliense DSM 45435 TaxID=1121364 RepID=A0ABY7U8Y6_9CORY|nr:hypothetical protein [Corynebacterium massiliense]WCZ33054.1 hypothetical protein CMASS_08135 [Corynebacterium massiliense DSM 45435]